MGTDLRNGGFTSMMRLPSHASWLAGQDLGASYRRYREALQLLSVRDPRRFVLRRPPTRAELDHLIAAFPAWSSCRSIHRHRAHAGLRREPVRGVPGHLQRRRRPRGGRPATGRSERDVVSGGPPRCASTSAEHATFVDVDYDDLVAHPADVVGRVYDAGDSCRRRRSRRSSRLYHAAHPATLTECIATNRRFRIEPRSTSGSPSLMDSP